VYPSAQYSQHVILALFGMHPPNCAP
jgi:hypothetical protein